MNLTFSWNEKLIQSHKTNSTHKPQLMIKWKVSQQNFYESIQKPQKFAYQAHLLFSIAFVFFFLYLNSLTEIQLISFSHYIIILLLQFVFMPSSINDFLNNIFIPFCSLKLPQKETIKNTNEVMIVMISMWNLISFISLLATIKDEKIYVLWLSI